MRSNTIPSVLLALVVAGTMHGRGQAQDAPSAAKPAEKAAELPAVAPTAPPAPAVKEAEATPLPPETPPMGVPTASVLASMMTVCVVPPSVRVLSQSNSISTPPTCRMSLCTRGWTSSPSIFTPLTRVPLVLPSSRTP